MTELRQRLPNRRPALTGEIAANGVAFAISAGIDPATGRIREVFLSAEKQGSALDTLARDAAVVISVALQCGVTPAQLAHSVEGAQSNSATPIGAALDWIIEIETPSLENGGRTHAR